MRAAFKIFMPGKAAPMLAALILSGCVTTYDDGYYPARPLPAAGPPYGVAIGHYANFGDYAGPIFGYPGDIFFIREGRNRFRIMGHHDDLLGFAYIEHDYRVRIVDPYGATLYWYYLRPDGHYHILDINYGHLGTLSPGHRHFINFNLFSRKHIRHYRRHEIDNDRHNIEREVHVRSSNRGGRDRDHDRDRGRDRGRDRDDDHDDADRSQGYERDRDRDYDGNYERSAPAASRRPTEMREERRPAEMREERRPVVTPTASEEPRVRRRNIRRVRDQGTSQLTPPAVQQPRSAPTAISPSQRENVARSRTLQQGRITTDSDTNASSPPSAQRVRPSRARSIAPVAQPRRAPEVAPEAPAPAPATVAKAKDEAKAKAETSAETSAKTKAKDKAKAKREERKKRRDISKNDRKKEFESDQDD